MHAQRARKAALALALVTCMIANLVGIVFAATPQATTVKAVTWTLSAARMANPGQTRTGEHGMMTTGCVIEATAKGQSAETPVSSGTFRMTVTAFKPAKDMPGQPAGQWYVSGNWTITGAAVRTSGMKLRYAPNQVTGYMKAVMGTDLGLAFTAATPQALTGTVLVSSAEGRSVRGEGTFTGTARFEGTLQAALTTVSSEVVAAAPGVRNVPGDRAAPHGTVPNPGTQQQELANITAPAPYNAFEFVVTCAACHGGTIDQQAGHFGNWAGTSMASATRDPIFRANQVIVNNTLKDVLQKDGAGNLCFRCHSPNGWMSGRFDPTMAGSGDGETLEHSILLSTDTEGILCEMCHRTMGNVTMKRGDLDPSDPVWNMMAGIDDWPHGGNPYPDGPVAGNPYGDATLQINDGMTYAGKYAGSVNVLFSDLPTIDPATGQPTPYTGQTYAVYPDGWQGPKSPVPPDMPQYNVAMQEIAYAADGSVPIHFEEPIGPPLTNGQPDYQMQGISLEHPTVKGDFIRSPEFCGSCHDLTVPVLNHGMPEQRTYTEWKYSQFGQENTLTYKRCQDCHMPTMKHEYADDAPVSLNPDPTLAGWFPYGKDRNPNGGTTFHKFAGANRDLPEMMKVLYPEVDLEVIGAPTGRDTRIFPGMMSSRDLSWDRARRNTEVSLNDAVDVDVTQPVYDAGSGRWKLNVRVTNNTGHRIPSGYPDGRRMWVRLVVTDQNGNTVYESGHYDEETATLTTDANSNNLSRAMRTLVDSNSNAVLVYEKLTAGGNRDRFGAYTISPNLLNDKVVYDTRIPPKGYDYEKYREAGTKIICYNPGPRPNTAKPYEYPRRFGPVPTNFDYVLFMFDAPANAQLRARAEVYWQTHTREFMEHLKDSFASLSDKGPRPQGGPSLFAQNYPQTPNYLSDVIGLSTMTDLAGNSLQDNWGGIAYASWLKTGKGKPFLVAADDTGFSTAPEKPADVTATVVDPFAIRVAWKPVRDAEGYIVWVRYGLNDATASWDRLAIVTEDSDTSTPGTWEFINDGLNVGKTYFYRVQAFNGIGKSPFSDLASAITPDDMPLDPMNLQLVSVTDTTATLSWYDQADNETGFIIERQDVPLNTNEPLPLFAQVGIALAGNAGMQWTDTTLLPGRTYNYRVAAFNNAGSSVWNGNGPVAATTLTLPPAPTRLTATSVNANGIGLSWQDNSGSEVRFELQRSTSASFTNPLKVTLNPDVTTYTDSAIAAATSYYYRVFAVNLNGTSSSSNVLQVSTPSMVPPAPSNLKAIAFSQSRVDLTWTDGSTNENGFAIERSVNGGAFDEMARVGANVASYSDTTTLAKTSYQYRVRAYNGVGLSGYSNTVSLTTPDAPPAAPTQMRIAATDTRSITVAWNDNASNEQGYYLERSADGVNWALYKTLGANTSTFRDSAVARQVPYWYRVRAFNGNSLGLSAYSGAVMGMTQ